MERDNGTANPSYPLIGQVVGGRYHIIELIGEGGMGVVYKAEQRLGSTVRRVAVKTLHAELSRDPSITARFHREVGTVAQLEHPNTVRVYDFGSTDDGTLYIAMEFLDGRALNRVIETEGALEPRRVSNLIRQVAGSLDEAHRQGIVHRDLKPENVLLIERAGEKDVVKLVDFGIAARTESADREKEQKLTQQGMVLGTPPYMSPEQFTGKHLDARSDVYSLGIMVYEMLTGQLPFQADTPWQWATHHMTSQPRSFDEIPNGSQIPESLRRTVLKSLSKDPQERQSSAGQFYAEFNAGLAHIASGAARAAAGGKTEAMPQPAPLAMAPTEGMPAAMPFAKTSPAMASPPVALPPAPPRERPEGGRGLKYALSGVAGVLLLAMGVAALTNSKGSGGEPPPFTLTPAAETNAVPAPAPTAEADEPGEVDSPEAEGDTPKPERPKPATTKPAAAKPAAAKPPTQPPTQPPTTQPPATQPAPSTPLPATPAPQVTPPAAPPPAAPAPTAPPVTPRPAPASPAPSAPAAAADPCGACARAAREQQIATAGQLYAQCADANGQKKCSDIVAQVAPKAAQAAAFNGQCAQARLIIAAAVQMRVPEARMSKAINACK